MSNRLRNISEYRGDKNLGTITQLKEKASSLPTFFGNKPSLFNRSEELIERLPAEGSSGMEPQTLTEIKKEIEQDLAYIEKGLVDDQKYDSAELRETLEEIKRLAESLV